MVAEVIKLPQSTPTGFQTNQVNVSVGVGVTPANIIRSNVAEQSKIAAEQASQNLEVIRKAASDLNEFAEKIQTSLKFSVDEGSGRTVITVTDSQTGDVIRQIPAKEVLAVANLLREFTANDVDKVGLLLADQG